MEKNNFDKRVIKKGLLPYLFIFLIMLGVFLYFKYTNNEVHTLTYDEFVDKLDGDKIKELELTARGSGYIYEVTGTLDSYKKDEYFEATLPLSDEVMKKIVVASDEQDFKLTVYADPESSQWLIILVNFGV